MGNGDFTRPRQRGKNYIILYFVVAAAAAVSLPIPFLPPEMSFSCTFTVDVVQIFYYNIMCNAERVPCAIQTNVYIIHANNEPVSARL